MVEKDEMNMLFFAGCFAGIATLLATVFLIMQCLDDKTKNDDKKKKEPETVQRLGNIDEVDMVFRGEASRKTTAQVTTNPAYGQENNWSSIDINHFNNKEVDLAKEFAGELEERSQVSSERDSSCSFKPEDHYPPSTPTQISILDQSTWKGLEDEEGLPPLAQSQHQPPSSNSSNGNQLNNSVAIPPSALPPTGMESVDPALNFHASNPLKGLNAEGALYAKSGGQKAADMYELGEYEQQESSKTEFAADPVHSSSGRQMLWQPQRFK